MGIFRDQEFEEQAGAIQPDLHRLDDALSGAEQRVSESPESGIATPVPGIYVAPTVLPDGDGRQVRVSIFYTYDGKDSTFRTLRRAP